MVLSLERGAQGPPLSVILPRLYLGAESDVTQERLASLGISYVLSVSRCSPQPSFLPRSRYLRVPIDDSLRDDLLPWIPQALRFIDAATSSGASVLVHCAAGISRSPALAVAYVMYSLGMDLDHAYRFVKERRPSISPNFNFLGQLQYFQGTLTQEASSSSVHIQQLANLLPSNTDGADHTRSSQQVNDQAVAGISAEQMHEETNESGNRRPSPSGRMRPLHVTNQQQVQLPREFPAANSSTSVKAALKPVQLQVPSGSTSLLEKRKSLSLSLTPLGLGPPSPASRCSQKAAAEVAERPQAKTPKDTSLYRRKTAETHECSGAQVSDQGPLSPFSFTLNKLLGWGGRLLLGGVFVQPVRLGQPALPYRC